MQVSLTSHYYPFGMLMPERSYRWVYLKGTNYDTDPTDVELASVNGLQDPSTIASEFHSYRFGFNGKENDNEVKGTGNSVDFGARIYDSRIGNWLSLDPLANKYPSLSPYCFVADNPINAIDPDGKVIIFVNGYVGFGSPPAGGAYWGAKASGNESGFVEGAMNYFNDNKASFTNFEPGEFSSPADRFESGKTYAQSHLSELTLGVAKDKEVIRIVTHSMGAAFGEGVAEHLKSQGYNVETIVHIEPYQAAGTTTTESNPNGSNTLTIDYQLTDDPVLNYGPTNVGSKGDVKGADKKVREKSGIKDASTRHASPIWSGKKFWEKLKDIILKDKVDSFDKKQQDGVDKKSNKKT